MTTLNPLAAIPFRQRDRMTYFIFLMVPAVLYVAAYIYPTIETFRLSFFEWDGFSPPEYIGLENYWELLGEPRFRNAFFNNLKWLVFYLTLPTVTGLALALLLDAELRGSVVFRTIFFIPFTITTVAVASAWRWMYKPSNGVMTQFVEALGFDAPNWLGDPSINTYSIMGAALWAWSGFTFLIYFGGLRALPTELIEAARIDGAKFWTILFKIKLPLLWPSTIVVLGIAAVDSMKIFDLVWAMTQGGPYRSSSVLAVEMYETSFVMFKLGQGAAVAFVLLVVASIVVMPYIYHMTRQVDEVKE
ncbi:carbohydrate ABC transporter permease [Pseudoruegeria sp. HB172150]|uniref:carbohydrate ABC transporter permease n=1 Tax=Pseudoruegeria sp. HB172150 TaxID=2721164 RepID=UPI001C12FC11